MTVHELGTAEPDQPEEFTDELTHADELIDRLMDENAALHDEVEYLRAELSMLRMPRQPRLYLLQ